MPINKIRVSPGAVASYTGEWTQFKQNSDTGGVEYTSRDTVVPARSVSATVKVPISGTSLHSSVTLAWANPEPVAILITRAVLDRTTAATGACTLDIGTTATSATTSSDNLIDGVDANATAATEDNITDKGSNGKARQKLAAAKWVTITEASGSAAGLVGNLYITYTVL